LADWFIGPCRTEKATDAELIAFAESIIVDSSKFSEAFANTPNINEKRFNRIAELLMHVAQELSALSYNNIKLAKEITIRKEFENQLRKSEQELRDANDSKDRFLSIIAHDLKSPLAALRSMLDLLNADLSDFSDSDIKEIIGEMDNSAKNVFELLEDLLSWSRAQTGKIQFNPDNIDISMILGNTISLMKASADKKNIRLYAELSQGWLCYGDANMISTVLRNLVSNAIKFTYPGGEVSVLVTQLETFMEISVIDTGIGISPENIEKLFKLDSHLTTLGTSQEKGTGLGLILCKEFVEANDGRIWVESQQGKGCTFKFTLPKANNPTHQ
jgi:signal transduction histidine kinase